MSDKTARLNRFLGSDGRCFDVAIDHGFFNEHSFLGGIEDMQQAIRTIVSAGPDAIQLSPGEARLLQSIPGRHKPSLVLRTDIANVYGSPPPRYLFSQLIEHAVEQAVQLDAACICVNLLRVEAGDGRQSEELYHQCVRNVCQLKHDCDRLGMPLMVEPLVMRFVDGQKYGVNGNLQEILPLVRQAVELGADVIKADPCSDIREYHRVVQIAAPRPILVRGGSRASNAELLQRTHELMQQGARGIVYGRNVIQHPNPSGMTRALMAIVHENKTPQEVAPYLEEK